MKKIFRFLLVVFDVISILSLVYFILWMFWRILSDFSSQVFLVVLMAAAFLSLLLLIPSIALLLALRKPTYEGPESPILMAGFGVLMPAFLLPLLILNGGSGGFSGLMMFLFLSGAAWMFFYYVAVDWLREKRVDAIDDDSVDDVRQCH